MTPCRRKNERGNSGKWPSARAKRQEKTPITVSSRIRITNREENAHQSIPMWSRAGQGQCGWIGASQARVPAVALLGAFLELMSASTLGTFLLFGPFPRRRRRRKRRTWRELKNTKRERKTRSLLPELEVMCPSHPRLSLPPSRPLEVLPPLPLPPAAAASDPVPHKAAGRRRSGGLYNDFLSSPSRSSHEVERSGA